MIFVRVFSFWRPAKVRLFYFYKQFNDRPTFFFEMSRFPCDKGKRFSFVFQSIWYYEVFLVSCVALKSWAPPGQEILKSLELRTNSCLSINICQLPVPTVHFAILASNKQRRCLLAVPTKSEFHFMRAPENVAGPATLCVEDIKTTCIPLLYFLCRSEIRHQRQTIQEGLQQQFAS